MINDVMSFGEYAYQVYGNSVEWRNFQGNPMPLWEDLSDAIREAWEEVGDALYDIGYDDGRYDPIEDEDA